MVLKQLFLLIVFTEQTDSKWLFGLYFISVQDSLGCISFMLSFFLCRFVKSQVQNAACFWKLSRIELQISEAKEG
jgi:hypothetical protein